MHQSKKRTASGATKILSSRAADAEDLRSSDALAATLLSRGAGAPELVQDRAAACAAVEACLAGWVRAVGLSHGLSAAQADEAGCRVLTLGSQALGVPGPGSDVDCVAIVPYFVERHQFFAADGVAVSLRAGLEGLDIESLHPVPTAFIPVIKFVVNGVAVDLLLARLRLPQIPRSLSADSGGLLHKCIEDTDAHSLNGARVASAILRRVPHVQRFQATLRAVKLWARRRGVDQAASGFPGGVAWALLTARVCQLHPNAAPSTLLTKFFMTWAVWRFGENAIPVLLDDKTVEPEDGGDAVGDSAAIAASAAATEDEMDVPAHLAASDWNAARDRGYLMPVITPCRPRLCTTHTVMKSTLAVLRSEIGRAGEIAKAAMEGKAPAPGRATTPVGDNNGSDGNGSHHGAAAAAAIDERWSPLFNPTDFFSSYNHYVAAHLSASSDSELLHWRAFVKARLHKLVSLLEKVNGVSWVHPLSWPMATLPVRSEGDAIDPPSPYCTFFVGIRFASGAGEPAGGGKRQLDLRPAATSFHALATSWEDKAELCPSAQMLVRHAARAELPAALSELPAEEWPFLDELDVQAIRGHM